MGNAFLELCPGPPPGELIIEGLDSKPPAPYFGWWWWFMLSELPKDFMSLGFTWNYVYDDTNGGSSPKEFISAFSLLRSSSLTGRLFLDRYQS